MPQYTRDYVLSLAAQGLTLLDREYNAFYEADAERWTRAHPDTGLPMRLVVQVEAEQHQGSRRVGPPRRVSFLRRLLKRLTCSR
jgi:hypothetical protein